EPGDVRDRHPVEEPGALRDVTDPAAQGAGLPPAILPQDGGLAPVRADKPGEHGQGGGFPAALGAHQGEDGAPRPLEGQPRHPPPSGPKLLLNGRASTTVSTGQGLTGRSASQFSMSSESAVTDA